MNTAAKVVIALSVIGVIVLIIFIAVTSIGTDETNNGNSNMDCGNGSYNEVTLTCDCENGWVKDRTGKCTQKRCVNGTFNQNTGNCDCDVNYVGKFCESIDLGNGGIVGPNTGQGGVGGTGGNADKNSKSRIQEIYERAYANNPDDFILMASRKFLYEQCLHDPDFEPWQQICWNEPLAKWVGYEYEKMQDGEISKTELVEKFRARTLEMMTENGPWGWQKLRDEMRSSGITDPTQLDFYDSYYGYITEHDSLKSLKLEDLIKLSAGVNASEDYDWAPVDYEYVAPPDDAYCLEDGTQCVKPEVLYHAWWDTTSRQEWEPIFNRTGDNSTWMTDVTRALLGGNPHPNDWNDAGFQQFFVRNHPDWNNAVGSKGRLDPTILHHIRQYLKNMCGRWKDAIGTAGLYDCRADSFLGLPSIARTPAE